MPIEQFGNVPEDSLGNQIKTNIEDQNAKLRGELPFIISMDMGMGRIERIQVYARNLKKAKAKANKKAHQMLRQEAASKISNAKKGGDSND